MNDYSEQYRQKLTDAASLAARVESGWVIGMDAATAHTPAIMSALAARAAQGELKDVKVQTLLDVYPLEFYADKSLDGKINGVSWFAGGGARKAINAGFADFIPNYYRDIPGLIRRYYDYDVVCASVSPMDEHGYFSLGCVSSYSEAMLEKSKRIFIEVNDRQPRAVCGLQIHVSQVDGIIENNMPLPVLPAANIDETSRTIGGYIAELIPDGACIQLGIGAIPDATGMALKQKHDLGIHTEMFTDSMVELIECGAVNNSKKQIHRGVSVTTFAFGSQRIYDYINDNPAIALMPVDYVNDPNVICRNDNMISINAALEVDFWGQVCAESVGTRHEAHVRLRRADRLRPRRDAVEGRQELYRLFLHGQGRRNQQDQVHPHARRGLHDEQERRGLHRHRVRRGASARPEPGEPYPSAHRHRASRFPRPAYV